MVGQVRQESAMSYCITRHYVANSVSKGIYCSLETGLSFHPRKSRRSLKNFIRDIKESTDATLEQGNLFGDQDCQPRWNSTCMSRTFNSKMHSEKFLNEKAITANTTARISMAENYNRPVPTWKYYLPNHCGLFFPISRSRHSIINHFKMHHPSPEKHVC